MTASQPSSPGAAPISDDSQEPGLWLWQGEAPLESEAPPQGEAPPQSEAPARPPSRVERIAESRRLRRTTGWVVGAAGGLVSDRARGIRHGARAAGRRANPWEYPRRGTSACAASGRCGAAPDAIAEPRAPGQPRAAGRHDGRAGGPSGGAVGVNRPKDGRPNRTQTSQMAGPAPVAARRKEGARFPPLPVDTGALPVSMRRLGGGNDMARRRLLICCQRETLNPPARQIFNVPPITLRVLPAFAVCG